MKDKDKLPQKRYELVRAYKEGLFRFIDKFEIFGGRYKHQVDRHAKTHETKLLKPVDNIDQFLSGTIQQKATGLSRLSDMMKKFDEFKRKSTMPFSYIDFYIAKMKAQKSTSLLMQQGVHYMVALMGGGKSSLIFHTIERLRTMYGRGAYVNVDLEEPHFDRLLNKTVCYHKRFEADDYWGAVEDKETKKVKFTQLKRFNQQFPAIVLDEWLSKMNHRQNNTSSYKEIFIPFIKSLAHMRHQGIHNVYVASQLDTTDVQLMGMFKYIHEVKIDLDISYLEWVKTGSLAKHIRGWQIYTYQVKRTKGKSDKVLLKSWYEPCIMDMSNFNSLNQAKEYVNLPYDKIKSQRSVS
ncbi:MAG: hypothetical protein K8Q99_04310 [Acholeplasmataceae bacterium]|nr:hypothetical protein [Acholeplasmataceae bacterium]